MRLIDADNIKEKILAYWGCDPSYYEGVEADMDTYLLSRLEITPTVEAIPITLIEDWRKERVNELIKELVRICTEFESKLLEAEKKILEAWEKENEENNL